LILETSRPGLLYSHTGMSPQFSTITRRLRSDARALAAREVAMLMGHRSLETV